MSFSSDVKNELSMYSCEARHCVLAELAALVGMCGSVCISAAGSYKMRIHTENITVARKCFTLLQKTFNIDIDVSVYIHKGRSRYRRPISFWYRCHAAEEHLYAEPSWRRDLSAIRKNHIISRLSVLLRRGLCSFRR